MDMARPARGAIAALLACGCAVAVGCPGRERPQPPPPPLPLDQVLGPGQVRCGPVTRTSELIGGVAATAEVGRSYKCYNALIRFIVQDGSRPTGHVAYGGDLIDVDLVRPVDTPGNDTFRELMPGVGYNEVQVESIEVVDDGRSGQQAILRLVGRPVPPSAMPGAYWFNQPVPGRLQTDYILRPDQSYFEIRTTVYNESDDNLGPLAVADFIAPGSSTALLAPGFGFGDVPLLASLEFLAFGHAARTSYAYVCSGEKLMVPFVHEGITVPICTDKLYVGAQESYSRYLVVGDGSLESVLRVVRTLQQKPTGEITGTVRLPDGTPASAVWVTALIANEDSAWLAANEARTDDSGAYRLTLPAGGYQLVGHVEGRGRSERVAAEVAAGATRSIDLTLGGQGRLRLATDFLDRSGARLGPQPAKLSLLAQGDTQQVDAVLGDRVAHGLTAYQVRADGEFAVALPPGHYRALVSRGFEYSRWDATVEVVADDVTDASAAIQHVIDSRGLAAGDFHQHCLASTDGSVDCRTKLLENAAEGLIFAPTTDHENVNDWRPLVPELGLQPFVVALPGDEVTYQGIAHFNVFPWAIDPADPTRDAGARIWFMHTFPDLFAELRQRAGDCILQVNHPRADSGGYFTVMRLDPSQARLLPQEPNTIPTLPPDLYQAWSAAFDAVEVNDNLGAPEQFTVDGWQEIAQTAADRPYRVPALADYFALLGAGLPVAITGNSDSHGPNSGVGHPRTFVAVDRDPPVTATLDDLRAAFRSQRTTPGRGCLIELFAGSERPMGLADLVAPAQRSDLRVRVQAPPYAQTDGLELYLNGMAQPLAVRGAAIAVAADGVLRLPLDTALAQGEVVRADAPLVDLPAGDSIVVAIARGSGGLWPTGFGSVYCVSAPLYLDDGDGTFVPWLTATQQLIGEP